MLYSTLLVAASAFSSFVVAQNASTPIGACCTVDANRIPDDQKADWCQAEQNTCPEICGGQGQIASGGNDCDNVGLVLTCNHHLIANEMLSRTLSNSPASAGTAPNPT